tara:strand:- start:4511 stop:4762 length:252 start_codon:yes stop_codon:yes gene_type:complete
MARDAVFWRWYASSNDNLRHELIERAWYGHETTANIDDQDMPGLSVQQAADPARPHQGTVWEQEDQAGAQHAPAIEPPQQEQE